MQSPFANSVLLLHFNDEQYLYQRQYFASVYSPWFKKVVFYSTRHTPKYPLMADVHYTDYEQLQAYSSLFDLMDKEDEESMDGIFFLMDDCFLNVQMLQHLDPNQLFLHYRGATNNIAAQQFLTFEELRTAPHSSYWFASPQGEVALAKAGIDKAIKKASDCFYLPQRLFADWRKTSEPFLLAKVFIEFAVPTVFKMIADPNIDTQQMPIVDMKWEEQRSLIDKNYVFKGFANDIAAIHPVKISNPDLLFTPAEILRLQYPEQERNLWHYLKLRITRANLWRSYRQLREIVVKKAKKAGR